VEKNLLIFGIFGLILQCFANFATIKKLFPKI